MQEEEVRGPIELTDKKADDLSDDGGNEEGFYFLFKIHFSIKSVYVNCIITIPYNQFKSCFE